MFIIDVNSNERVSGYPEENRRVVASAVFFDNTGDKISGVTCLLDI